MAQCKHCNRELQAGETGVCPACAAESNWQVKTWTSTILGVATTVAAITGSILLKRSR